MVRRTGSMAVVRRAGDDTCHMNMSDSKRGIPVSRCLESITEHLNGNVESPLLWKITMLVGLNTQPSQNDLFGTSYSLLGDVIRKQRHEFDLIRCRGATTSPTFLNIP